MQTLSSEAGKNPPEVIVAALALIDYFRRANEDQEGNLFKTLVVMAGHLANSKLFPLPQSFSEIGLTGPPEELTDFFEDGMFSENTRAALKLLSNDENANGSEFGVFLHMAKENLI